MTVERVERFAELGVHRLILLPGSLGGGMASNSDDLLAAVLRFIETTAEQLIA